MADLDEIIQLAQTPPQARVTAESLPTEESDTDYERREEAYCERRKMRRRSTGSLGGRIECNAPARKNEIASLVAGLQDLDCCNSSCSSPRHRLSESPCAMPSTPTSASQFFSYTSPRDGGSPGHFSVLRRRAHTLSILHSGSHGPSSPIKPSLMSESLAHHASYHICGRDTSSSPLMRTSSALSQWSPHGRTTSPSPQSPVITTLHSSPAQEEHPAH